MGIFKPKTSDEEKLNRKMQEEIERTQDSLNTKRQLYEMVRPIIQKYGQCFDYCSFMLDELSLSIKEDTKVDPEIYCDAGKIGLVAMYEAPSFYGSHGYIKIKLL